VETRPLATTDRLAVGHTVIGLLVAALPTLALVALIHDLLPAHPSRWVSQALALSILVAMTMTIGRAAAAGIARDTGARRAGAILAGSLPVTLIAAWTPLQLLRADVPSTARLAWMLGEEDNAQIVGVAREVLVTGPAGQGLAETYGTGFVVGAITLLRVLGSTLLDLDPRLAAIAVFTLSVGIAILVLGVAVLLVLLLAPSATPRHGLLELPPLALTCAAVTAIALGVAVVVPMRTGFLTFVWSLAWLSLGTAVLLIPARGAWDRIALTVHTLACALLVVRSWPFVIVGSLVTIAICARWLPWRRLRGRIVHGRGLIVATAGGLAVATGAAFYLRDSLFGEVLSYGRAALTIVASGIEFDRVILTAVLVALAILLLQLIRAHQVDRIPTLTVLGPVGAVGASWIGLNMLALLLTGGELNYAGWKLVYAFVALGAVLALPAVARFLLGRSTITAVGVTIVSVAILLASPTALEIREWGARLAPAEPPHAVAVIEAIEATSPDVAIRCRPALGTPVTSGSRLAAYFCVRWVEDAFNEDRSRGLRFEYFNAQGDTFDPIIEAATQAGEYGLLSRILQLGPGWFGWDGVS
jgi:hypothetical protein